MNLGDLKKQLTIGLKDLKDDNIEPQLSYPDINTLMNTESVDICHEITLVVKKEKLKQGDTIIVNGIDYLIKVVRDKGNKLKVKLARVEQWRIALVIFINMSVNGGSNRTKAFFPLYYYPIKVLEYQQYIKYGGRGTITRLRRGQRVWEWIEN